MRERPLEHPGSKTQGAIIIELFGPPASGKTTLARALHAAFNDRGWPGQLISSARPAEKGHSEGTGRPRHGVLAAPLLRASNVLDALPGLVPGRQADPLVSGLLATLPPKSLARKLRSRRYLTHLLQSWASARASGGVVIFDQGFLNALCSLALQSGGVERQSLERGLALAPIPDVLVRIDTSTELVRTRLQKRLHRLGFLERLFETDLEASLRQAEVAVTLDSLLAQLQRRSIRASWNDREEMTRVAGVMVAQIIADQGHRL